MSLLMSQLYDERHILIPVVAATRDELFHLLAKTLAERDDLDEKKILDGISARESMMSTSIAPGIALPHTQLDGLGRATGLLAVIPAGCDYGGGIRIRVAALIVDDSAANHQEALRQFALLAKNPRFLEKVTSATDPAHVRGVIERLEMTS